MKITAKLAYSQLKINRSRTFWTLAAIVLSAALTTAVSGFVASGNAMLVDFHGGNYGVYGSGYLVLLLIPAAVFGIIIFAMSVTVISNVFRISAQERVSQFGILKCTGATKNQITETVLYESGFLCAAGIPAGILLGILLTIGGIGIVNHYLDKLNDLAHIMINEINLSLTFVFSWPALLVSAVLCFLTVLFSAWLPAHKAARVPAIDCVRGAGEVKINRGKVRVNPVVDKLFGFEGALADKNLKRNRRNFRATTISLSVGVILFISLGGLSGAADGMVDYMYPEMEHTVISDYGSAYRRELNESTGNYETIFLKPIDSEDGSRIAEKLRQFENISIFGFGNDCETYSAVLPEEMITKEMLEALEKQEEMTQELEVDLNTIDEKNYAALCEKAGLPADSVILLNHYRYNDFGKEVNLEPLSSSIKEIELVKADGSAVTVPIQGILTQEEIPAELFYPNTRPVRLIVPRAQLRQYSWYCSPPDIEGFIEFANSVLGEAFPSAEDSSYMEEGFSTRVYKIKDYISVMNIAFAIAFVFMYSFAALLMLIGLTNVISTLSTNVLMRSREFAVLKSVGMTPESLKKMLNYESILCSAKALLYGMPVGIAVSVLISIPIRMMFPVSYEIPWIPLLLCVCAVFLITWGTTRYAAHKIKNQNIIETIRSESGR